MLETEKTVNKSNKKKNTEPTHKTILVKKVVRKSIGTLLKVSTPKIAKKPILKRQQAVGTTKNSKAKKKLKDVFEN